MAANSYGSCVWDRVRATSILAAVTILAIATGVGYSFAATLGRIAEVPTPSASSESSAEDQDALTLARAFTAAQNAHAVDALVELFTDEDAGPSVAAERYAWLKFEIRRWAQRQADMAIQVDAYDYRITEHGAVWDADVYRSDWAAAGVRALAVTNSIWVHNGRVASFTSIPRSTVDATRLGWLWRPGASPEPWVSLPEAAR